MIRVGIVGFGFMGRMHYRCWKAVPDAQVTAVCSPDLSKQKTGNLAGAADAVDLTGVKTVQEFDALLAAGVVDAISLTVPTYLHADFSVRALAAGLHVLCEKPMALNVADCDRMIAAAKQSGKVLQIGHCLRFWPEYEWTRQAIQSGRFGAVLAASFRRFGSSPAWGGWFADEKRSGGMALDLHCHDADFIQQVWGLPVGVHSTGNADLSHIATQYVYGSPVAITAEGGWRMPTGFGFEMSFNVVLEQAVIQFDSTRQPAFRVIPEEPVSLPSGDGYHRQVEHFLKRVQGVPVEDVVPLEQSRETIRIIVAEKESARKHKLVEL